MKWNVREGVSKIDRLEGKYKSEIADLKAKHKSEIAELKEEIDDLKTLVKRLERICHHIGEPPCFELKTVFDFECECGWKTKQHLLIYVDNEEYEIELDHKVGSIVDDEFKSITIDDDVAYISFNTSALNVNRSVINESHNFIVDYKGRKFIHKSERIEKEKEND